jgi:hypothetical protein
MKWKTLDNNQKKQQKRAEARFIKNN